MTSRRVLVTGGQRSGKSSYAESLVRAAAWLQAQRLPEPESLTALEKLAASHGPPGEGTATYIAAGPRPDPRVDPEWAARVAAHRMRRPSTWVTVETVDLPEALQTATPPVLIDCLGTWLTAVLDELDAWTRNDQVWRHELDRRVDDLVAAWSAAQGLLVAVTNEVGLGLVSEHRSGRIFADQLGRLNQRIAAVSDDVVLVVAGRTLHL
jgi:adenosylcobinamide kinase / adenosylcobinamide-phosphate guanylyltransferase